MLLLLDIFKYKIEPKPIDVKIHLCGFGVNFWIEPRPCPTTLLMNY